MDRPPIAGGALLIDSDGRIAAMGSSGEVGHPVDVSSESQPDVILLPGLINTHTHLELTGLGALVPEPDFADWIRRLIALKSARSGEQVLEAARQGIRAGWSAGVTTLGDTGDSGAGFQAMLELNASGIAYQEVFGPHPDLAEAQFAEFRRRFDRLRPLAAGRVRLGVSPHAPYSVSGPLYQLVARWASVENLPVAVHVAESLEESQLVESAGGPFARQWTARGIPLPRTGGSTPIEWLDRHGVLGRRTLCIHAVRATDSDITRIARAGASVAHCPRSNRRHARLAAPLGRLLAAGIRVGVGTDSVASVSPQDLLAEARQARQLADLSAETALRLVTSGAAAALGLEAEIGSLAPGHWGDAVAIRIPPAATAEQALELALASRPDDVVLTILGGREVYRRVAA
ncbi:MAG: amidohydrolase family protein [Gemmatimonadota bacterium]